MIFLSIIEFAVPTLLAIIAFKPESVNGEIRIQLLNDSLAIILLGVYIAGIIFTFITHKYLFAFPMHSDENNNNNNNTLSSFGLKHGVRKSHFCYLDLVCCAL